VCEKSDGGEHLSCRAYMHERATMKLMLGSSSCRVKPCQVMQQCSRLILSLYDLWLLFYFHTSISGFILIPLFYYAGHFGSCLSWVFPIFWLLRLFFHIISIFLFLLPFFCSHIISFPLSIPLVLSLDCW